MAKIHIIDAPCGSYKTTSAINLINKTSSKKSKFLYITPYLSEINRIKEGCKKKRIVQPKEYGTKIKNIHLLFDERKNIASTHSLFSMFNEESVDMDILKEYTLIMDEVADVVKTLEISKDDLDLIINNYTVVDSQNRLIWIADNYEGRFEDYKKLCQLGCLSCYGTGSSKVVLLWMFPIKVFESFKEVYILTYLFDAQIQKYYYDYYNVDYDYMYISNENFTKEKQVYDISKYKNLINICSSKKLNDIGNPKNSLSNSWFKNCDNKTISKLKNNCVNYFKNIVKTKSSENMWTTFKTYKNKLKGDGYAKGFVSLNMRSTNEFIDKSSIAYLSNRYINPVVKNFFLRCGVDVNEDLFALSELIQFIWRSRIRRGEPINVYIPSSRMRNLLVRWLENL